eukprot:381073_1
MDTSQHQLLLDGYIHELVHHQHMPREIFKLCWWFYFDEDRAMPYVVQPPTYPILHRVLFPDDQSIDLNALKEHLNREGRLELSAAIHIINKAKEILSKEPNVLKLNAPIAIHGDILGHFWNLQRSLEAADDMQSNLFLGNYVDRGCFGIEVILYLCAHKIMHPDSFHMLRGAHESRRLTKFFNFHDEAMYKYQSEELFQCIMVLFDQLPIAAVVSHNNANILCVSGGLSPDISTIDDIENIDRFQEVPEEGPLCDLLWSDPVRPDNMPEEEEEEVTDWFAYNETRQCSYVFGIEAVKCFLKKNNLAMIIRSHEHCKQGWFGTFADDECNPRVMTIRSAVSSNPIFSYNPHEVEKGAIIKLKNDDELNIRQFIPAPYPYYMPNFQDVFSWSLPFVAQKMVEMITAVLGYHNQKNIDNNAHYDMYDKEDEDDHQKTH